MKILLTSVYANIADKLLELIDDKPENITVAFIATAADVYLFKWFVDADRNKLIEQGFKIKEISLQSKNSEALEKEMSDCSVIFVAGGNVFYLLQEVRKSDFDKVIEKMRDKDIVYVGSSAGSVLAGPDIELASALDDPSKAPELEDYRGLNLVDFVVLPHYGNAKYEEKYKQIMDRASAKGLKTKTLRDDEYSLASGAMDRSTNA